MRRRLNSTVFFFVLFVCFVVNSPVRGAEPTYWRDVRPLLRKHCTVCHSVRTVKEVDVSAGLALDSYPAVVKDPKKPVVVPGKSADSELVRRLHDKDPARRMPLDADPLPPEAVTVLRR